MFIKNINEEEYEIIKITLACNSPFEVAYCIRRRCTAVGASRSMQDSLYGFSKSDLQ